MYKNMTVTLRKKVSVFRVLMVRIFPAFPTFGLNTERYFGEILREILREILWRDISGKCCKNADQDNSEYGHVLRSVKQHINCGAIYIISI